MLATVNELPGPDVAHSGGETAIAPTNAPSAAAVPTTNTKHLFFHAALLSDLPRQATQSQFNESTTRTAARFTRKDPPLPWRVEAAAVSGEQG